MFVISWIVLNFVMIVVDMCDSLCMNLNDSFVCSVVFVLFRYSYYMVELMNMLVIIDLMVVFIVFFCVFGSGLSVVKILMNDMIVIGFDSVRLNVVRKLCRIVVCGSLCCFVGVVGVWCVMVYVS